MHMENMTVYLHGSVHAWHCMHGSLINARDTMTYVTGFGETLRKGSVRDSRNVRF